MEGEDTGQSPKAHSRAILSAMYIVQDLHRAEIESPVKTKGAVSYFLYKSEHRGVWKALCDGLCEFNDAVWRNHNGLLHLK